MKGLGESESEKEGEEEEEGGDTSPAAAEARRRKRLADEKKREADEEAAKHRAMDGAGVVGVLQPEPGFNPGCNRNEAGLTPLGLSS